MKMSPTSAISYVYIVFCPFANASHRVEKYGVPWYAVRWRASSPRSTTRCPPCTVYTGALSASTAASCTLTQAQSAHSGGGTAAALKRSERAGGVSGVRSESAPPTCASCQPGSGVRFVCAAGLALTGAMRLAADCGRLSSGRIARSSGPSGPPRCLSRCTRPGRESGSYFPPSSRCRGVVWRCTECCRCRGAGAGVGCWQCSVRRARAGRGGAGRDVIRRAQRCPSRWRRGAGGEVGQLLEACAIGCCAARRCAVEDGTCGRAGRRHAPAAAGAAGGGRVRVWRRVRMGAAGRAERVAAGGRV